MAKKKFNVTSTLAKNKKTNLQPELAPKIPLRKSDKNLEDVKEKVDSLHSEESSVIKSPVVEKKTEPATNIRPNSRTQSVKKTAKKPAEPEKLVRLTIDTPAEMHTRLKVKAVLSGVSMRDYILKLLERELKKG